MKKKSSKKRSVNKRSSKKKSSMKKKSVKKASVKKYSTKKLTKQKGGTQLTLSWAENLIDKYQEENDEKLTSSDNIYNILRVLMDEKDFESDEGELRYIVKHIEKYLDNQNKGDSDS